MKKYVIYITILLSFVISSFSFAIDTGKEMNLAEIQRSYIVVKYKDGSIGKRLVSDFVVPKMKSLSMGEESTNQESEVEEAIISAKTNSEIEFAEPLIIFEATDTIPDDIIANDSWRFDLTGMNNLWDDFGLIDFSEITVAVIDTGVDLQNTDLNLDTLNDKDYVNNDEDADDDDGHGSHVAGVIGAIANNNTGIAGVASNVKILPIKVLDSFGFGTNDNVALAIRHAADHGADVINMSLSSGGESILVREAIEYAFGEGVIIVAAAGNSSNHWANLESQDEYNPGASQYVNVLGYPAAFPEVLAIGSILYDAINDDIYISDFSDVSGNRTINGVNQKVLIEVVAPGSHIYSYIDDGNVQSKSGTSMASPHVAALATVLKAKYNQLTNSEIRDIIQKTSSDVGIITPAIDSYSGAVDSFEDIYGEGLISYDNAFGFDGLSFLDIEAYDDENNELTINSFTFDHLTYNYSINVPINTSKLLFNGETMLMDSTIKLNDTSIANISNIEENFEVNQKDYVYEITSEYSEAGEEIIKNYTFDITRSNLSSDSDLSALSVTGHTLSPTFGVDKLNYTLADVSYDTSSIGVIATKNDANAQIQMKINDGDYAAYNSGDEKSFDLIQSIDNVISVKVTAEDSSTKEYTITVKRLSGNYLEALVIKNNSNQEVISLTPTFEKTTYNYSASVAYSVDQIDVSYTKEDSLSIVKIDDEILSSKTIDLVEGENTIAVKVYTDGEENTAFKNYTLTVTRATPSVDNDLSALSVTGHTFNEVFDSDTLNYTLPDVSYETSSINIIAVANDDSAQIEMKLNDGDYVAYNSGDEKSFDLIQSIDNVINVKVIAEDSSTKEYTITVKRFSGNYLEALVIKNTANQELISLDPVFEKTTYNYSASVAYSVDQIDVSYTKEDPLSIVKINDEILSTKTIDLVEGENTIAVKVYTDGKENTAFKNYTLTVTRAMPSVDNDLSALSVTDHALASAFAADTLNYTLADVSYDTSSIGVIAEKNDWNAQIQMKINDGDYVTYNSGDEKSFDLIQSIDNVIRIKVIAEDSSTKEYTITVKRLSGNYLEALVLKNTSSQQVISLTPDFDKTTYNYSVSVGDSVDQIDVNYTKEDTLSVVKIDDEILSTKTIDLVEGENTVAVKVYTPGEENTAYKNYTITVTKASVSNDNDLSALSVTGHSISPTFDGDNLNYTLPNVSHEVSSIVVTAVKNDVNAELSIDGTSYDTMEASKNIGLSYGSNSIAVEVIAENSNTKTYTITVTRNSPPETPPNDDGNTGGGGGGGGGGGAFFIPPPTDSIEEEPEPEPEDEISVIENETGSITVNVMVSEEKLLKALNDSALEFVEISGITDNDSKAVEVNINENNLTNIMSSEKSAKVTFDKVEFLLNNKILEALDLDDNLIIRSEIIDDNTIISREEIKGKAISEIFELNIYDKDKKIEKFGEEIPITLTYNATSMRDIEKIAIFYFNEDTNDWEYVGGKVIGESKITFKAKHFSKYAVREYEKTFADIQNHWAKNDIEILASKKITNGVSANEFAPDRKITNAEFVVLLSRVLNLEESDENINFSDVSPDAWYFENLRKAVSSNLLTGSFYNSFYPDEPIKRENMANILVNSYFYYTGFKASDIFITQEVKFNDEGSISQFLRNKVRISNGLGLILGDDLNNFNPNNGATRAEASTVIKRLLKLLELM